MDPVDSFRVSGGVALTGKQAKSGLTRWFGCAARLGSIKRGTLDPQRAKKAEVVLALQQGVIGASSAMKRRRKSASNTYVTASQIRCEGGA